MYDALVRPHLRRDDNLSRDLTYNLQAYINLRRFDLLRHLRTYSTFTKCPTCFLSSDRHLEHLYYTSYHNWFSQCESDRGD